MNHNEYLEQSSKSKRGGGDILTCTLYLLGPFTKSVVTSTSALSDVIKPLALAVCGRHPAAFVIFIIIA